MAEKEESAPIKNPPVEGMIVSFWAIFIIFLAGRLALYFDTTGAFHGLFTEISGGANGWYSQIVGFLQVFFHGFTVVSTIFSILVFLAIIYTRIRMGQLGAEEEKQDETPEVGAEASEMSAKWQKVQAHVNSDNPAEWRLSILEADVMLEQMLDSMSYYGATLGEKLKSVEKSDFVTIEYAWEAHKIRNAIAHEGADFLITQREAKRVIGLYERVFREFYYI